MLIGPRRRRPAKRDASSRTTTREKEVFLLDALLDELDGDCVVVFQRTCISFFVSRTQNALFDERGMSTSLFPLVKKRVDTKTDHLFFTSILFIIIIITIIVIIIIHHDDR